jgi:hypothetical protein
VAAFFGGSFVESEGKAMNRLAFTGYTSHENALECSLMTGSMRPCRKTEILKQPTNTLQVMNARKGKIARLPRNVRDELNERLERSEPDEDLKNSVKSTRTRETANQTREIKPSDVYNPLKANDIWQKGESGISPDQSNPVKPSQTDEDSAAISLICPIGPISPGKEPHQVPELGILQAAFSATAMNHAAPSKA